MAEAVKERKPKKSKVKSKGKKTKSTEPGDNIGEEDEKVEELSGQQVVQKDKLSPEPGSDKSTEIDSPLQNEEKESSRKNIDVPEESEGKLASVINTPVDTEVLNENLPPDVHLENSSSESRSGEKQHKKEEESLPVDNDNTESTNKDQSFKILEEDSVNHATPEEGTTLENQKQENTSNATEELVSATKSISQGMVEEQEETKVKSTNATQVKSVEQSAKTSVSVEEPTKRKSKVVHRKIYPQLKELLSPDIILRPFSDEQLKSLYYNPLLEHQQVFVDDFLQQAQQDKHEFYELLMNYYRARVNYVNGEGELSGLQKEFKRQEEMVWVTSEHIATAQGTCLDKVSVSENHQYLQVTFDDKVAGDINKSLSSIRTALYDSLALHAYSAQLSRLQVESYIHQLYINCPFLQEIPRNAPVQAFLPEQRSPQADQQMSMLKKCISILFLFQRRPVKDEQFTQDARMWLTRLVASLLRIATLEDHWFILNHVLRCPAGVGKWASNYIQLVQPRLSRGQSSLGGPLLDNFIAMLATLMLPVKARTDFLSHMNVSLTPSADNGVDNPWVLVDSDGEEDEDPANSWQYLQENDVVALLHQFPLDAVFRHALLIETDEEGQDLYFIHKSSEQSMLRLFAFATSLMKILGQGLQTFKLGRYRQFNKRIGRLVRHTIQFVSDHWMNFKSAFSHLPEQSKQRLQLELDHVFMRATDCILSAQKLGSWQFMADMPYGSVSMEMMWKLLWLLHFVDAGETVQFSVEICKQKMKDPDSKLAFEEKLLAMPLSEATYLLTAFTNMARSRPPEDIEFVNAITEEMFEISYVSTHTREFCAKTGRQLLATLATSHPCVISTLLRLIQQHLDTIGMLSDHKTKLFTVSMYLFRELPLFLWELTSEDLETIHHWVLNLPLVSTENQLGRLILSRLNYGLTKQEDRLFLDIAFHRKIAILIVESYLKQVAAKGMSGVITEGVKQVASVVSQQKTSQQQFHDWAWDTILKLRLHKHQQPRPVMGANEDQGFDPCDLFDPVMLVISKMTDNNGALACYVATVMTKIGHSVSEFLSAGLPRLQCLVQQHHSTAVIQVLYVIVPLFYDSPQPLIKSELFQTILHSLLSADQTYAKMAKSLLYSDFPGEIVKMLACMIQTQINGASAMLPYSPPMVIELWMNMLTQNTVWYQDRNVQYLINFLIKSGHSCKGGKEVIETLMYNQYKLFIKSQGGHSMVSSLVSWIATGSAAIPTFLEGASLPEFPWLAYHLLHAEEQYQHDSYLWQVVQIELITKPKLTVDQAVKKAIINLKIEGSLPASRLCIYRWGQQALDTAVDHPLLPLLWQRFFQLYLGRPAHTPGLPERGGIGHKFFESSVNTSLLKRMKKRLNEATEHHHKVLQEQSLETADIDTGTRRTADEERSGRDGEAEEEEEENLLLHNVGYQKSREFHQSLVRYYQTLGFWLEEPRLHDPHLYLPGLPPQYDAERLLKLFQNQTEPWVEFLDSAQLDYELSQMVSEWVTKMCPKANYRMRRNSMIDAYNPLAATERILGRLQRYEQPLPPPPLVPLKAPLPDVSPSILGDKDTLIYTISADLAGLVEYSKLFMASVSQHLALDLSYQELLPNLYRNEPTMKEMYISCKSTFSLSHNCKGPAFVTVRFEEKKRNESVYQRVEENRSEWKQLLAQSSQPPPQNICSAAVHVENVIIALIKEAHSESPVPPQYSSVGSALFYHMASMIGDETKYYPPTRQFFSSCIEILGQEFISPNPKESLPLLETILKSPSLGGLLAPHFFPNACPDTFVRMYEQVIDASQRHGCDVTFMLLTKFDVPQWLGNVRPVHSERSHLVETIGKALCQCGNEPAENTLMVFEVYRSHLKKLTSYEFPDQYGDVLKLLLNASSTGKLCPKIWGDFLESIGCKYVRQEGFDLSYADNMMQSQALTTTAQFKESIDWLSTYFMKLRTTTPSLASFGLYSQWKPYVTHISVFLGYLCGSLVLKTVGSLQAGQANFNPQEGAESVWQATVQVFAPWLEPLHRDNGEVLCPWIVGDTNTAFDMVAMFTESVACNFKQLEGFIPPFARNALTLVWEYYVKVLSAKKTPEHILQVFHARLTTLQWGKFLPDLQTLELMVKLQAVGTRESFVFLGLVFTQMPWQDIVNFYLTQQPAEGTTGLMAILFQLLIQMSQEKGLMDVQGSDLPRLLLLAESFPWHFLDADNFKRVSDWFLQYCDPKCVLAERSSNSAVVLRLLKSAAGFVSATGSPFHPETPRKRALYVHCVVELVCKCSQMKGVDPENFTTLILNLLTEVETVVSTIPDLSIQWEESVTLCVEVLQLLNNCNPQTTTVTAVLRSISQWIESSPCTVLLLPLVTAGCRCLASIVHMVQIIENCMDAFFNSGLELSESYGWGRLLSAMQIPELTFREFLVESLRQGSYLTLYAYVLQHLPKCQSLDEENSHIAGIVQWTATAKPTSENEAKLFLWWGKILDLLLRQIDFGASHAIVIRSLNNFIAALTTLGEDKISAGLLGAIGLGRASNLSVRFRLVARSLSAFLQAQIVKNNALRLVPHDHTPPNVQQIVTSLRNLKTNKQYTPLKEQIDFACQFVSSRGRCLRDAKFLLAELTGVLFPEKRYLAVVQNPQP
ncbi:ectopic P granules protein 5 homolog isoform X1 [Lingula anatina]|uniref:Ectopic P granules protein 5 homolog isoform X1 n=1 Tax=Lingula anatina TaxID=7574 RepID=A0A1S3JD42_LINAN|nr:ectopic P granules protein 5 homolog isoform X1 [Lingula anatina]|eukprot:XP_013408243.1 ectopic P granules protein 5 homolog isoform X1 [Lingula anatina]